MTTPFGRSMNGFGDDEFFVPADAQNHLLVIRVHDLARYFRSANCPDGMVYPQRGGEPFPNTVLRATVADLDVAGEDGQPGKIFENVVLFAMSLRKPLSKIVGQGPRLVMWTKGPKQTDEFNVMNMAANEQAVAAGTDFLNRHPEFLDIPAPEPYDGVPPTPRQVRPPQQQWNPGYQQGPPQQQYEQDPWQNRQQQTQWNPPQGQWGPPQSAPPAPNGQQGSFLARSQTQQPDMWNQHEPNQPRPTNHHGEPQDQQIPF